MKDGTFTLLCSKKTQQALADSAIAYLEIVTIPEAALPPEGDFPTYDVFEDREGIMGFTCGVKIDRYGGEILRCDLPRMALDDPKAWRLYTASDGLDSGRYARIIQTRDGAIWSASGYSSAQSVNRLDPSTPDRGPKFAVPLGRVRFDAKGMVQVYVHWRGDKERAREALLSHGARIDLVNVDLAITQAWLPVDSLAAVAALPFVSRIISDCR